MSSSSLQGRRVLLTGASRGIGLETAQLFLEHGAQLLGVAQNAERLAKVTPNLQERGAFHALPVDLTSPGAISTIVAHVERLWGALDLVIHNAAVMIAHDEGILGEPEGKLEATFETNVFVPFRLSRALAPLLLRGRAPRIINVSSGAGTFHGLTEPGIASYRLSKWALNGLTLLEAQEFVGKVSVVALDPGWVKTDLGGPKAPGLPSESARGLLKAALLAPDVTGQLFKNGEVIPW